MSTLYKLHIHERKGLVKTAAVSFRETEKMLRDVFWDESDDFHYCDRQINKDNLLKFKEGYMKTPNSGVVFCFEQDLEQGKQVLIEAVNKRTVAECARLKRLVDNCNREVAGVPGTLLINLVVETVTNDNRG